MAIDKIARISIVERRQSADRLIAQLHELGVVEIISTREVHEEAKESPLKQDAVHSREIEAHLHHVSFLLNVLDQFAPDRKSFVAGLAPVPVLVDLADLRETVANFPLEEVFNRAQALDEHYRAQQRLISQLQQEINQLKPLALIPAPMHLVNGMHHLKTRLVDVPQKKDQDFVRRFEEEAGIAIEPLSQNGTTRYWIAYRLDQEDRVQTLLKELHAQEVMLPRVQGTVTERLKELEEDLTTTREELEKTGIALTALGEHRHALLLLKAHWEGEQRKQLVHGQVMSGQWVSILTGYVRERDLPAVQRLLAQEFPTASINSERPGPDEDVPVSISHSKFVRPISLLITMYGLPRYHSFDPSGFLMISFFVFFGICFSDVGYGFLLCCASAYLAFRAREYAGVRNFAFLFFYAGITTMIFGAMLGSWFGDLFPKYLSEGNPLLRMQQSLMLFEPMNKPVVALILALSIGMVNQFYGITLRMYDAMRHGDWAVAIFDGLLWLILLPGLVIIIATLFVTVPAPLLTLGISLLIVGGIGLILTQGRAEKTILGKAAVGVISLYGIFGSYGCTAFIGDTLSYCRLLALGLTTGIVAMSINLIAGMISGVPYVGWLLFILLLVLGHGFNFAISVLGAFIHSARLIFVEFFGRFYEGGSRPFRPLGFDSTGFQLRR